MMIFMSPTKNMKPRTIEVEMTLPQFCVEAENLLEILQEYNDEDIMQIMKVNAKLAVENQERFQHIHFDTKGMHALTSYDGIAFKYMKLHEWTQTDYQYANTHLRILSAFYGVVRPFDSIYPYRLEMQARLKHERIDNLYSYWSDILMQSMRKDNKDGIYINLASKEYSDAILPYIKDNETCITIQFYLEKNGKRRIQATYAKMARGAMAAYIIRKQIEKPEGLKAFDEDGWMFDEETSTDLQFIFVKNEK